MRSDPAQRIDATEVYLNPVITQARVAMQVARDHLGPTLKACALASESEGWLDDRCWWIRCRPQSHYAAKLATPAHSSRREEAQGHGRSREMSPYGCRMSRSAPIVAK